MNGRALDAIVARLDASAAVDDREDVDLLAHALQCAQILASDESASTDEELVAAGLVHDLGWIVDPDDESGHAANGAALVRPVLGERVAHLVAGHADAKRYLVTTEPGYAATLSARSRATLVAQGAVMGADEVAAFERDPHLDALVALRRADDAAKTPGAPVAPLDHWYDLLVRVASRA